MLINQCIIILKSVHRHEILHECKVAISRATLHFQKVTKEQKQKRVDNGNEEVKKKTAAELTAKNDNSVRAIKLFAVTERIRRENLSQCAFCEGRLTKIFFIPFLTRLSLKIQLLELKSLTFHIPKEMKLGTDQYKSYGGGGGEGGAKEFSSRRIFFVIKFFV